MTGVDLNAGHPLRSSEGEPIGTSCLLDRRTHEAAAVSIAGLPEMALQADTALHRYETGPAAARQPQWLSDALIGPVAAGAGQMRAAADSSSFR
jgi:hypothetical protein